MVSTLLKLSLLPLVLADANLVPRLNNGLATTPPMGWNTYNHYVCAPNETIIHSNAQALIDLGLSALGYKYVTTDCGWNNLTRNADGTINWDKNRFPSGFPALGTFIHGLGLKFGVYSDSGIQSCMTGKPAQTGSLNHEKQDATSFAAWGADLLKYDNCYAEASANYPNVDYTPPVSPSARYKTMTNAITATGRAILIQICEWGVDFPSLWAPALGNTWRITNDIIPAYKTIARILNQAVPQTSFAGPGHWLDLDMLEVGNNIFTTAEEQTHFSLWAIIKSPLTIGCALKDPYTSISAASLAILKNKDVIGYNQDSLGVAASFRRRWTDDREIWAGPLSGSRTVVALINLENKARTLTLDLPDVGFQKAATLKDIWNGVTVNNVVTSYSAKVGAHGTLLLELGKTTPVGQYSVADATVSGTTTTFSKIYGITTSASYTAVLTFSSTSTTSTTITVNSITHTLPAKQASLSIPLTLTSSDTNTVSIVSTLAISTLQITDPSPTLYGSPVFHPTTASQLVTCTKNYCLPIGSRMTSLTASAPATATLTSPSNSLSGSKYLNIYFTNNDIAFSTSWTTGTNTRNLTLSVNGVTTRVEVPLSGRSSELFGVGKGWEDSGTFGVLVDGWKGSGNGNTVVVGGQAGDWFLMGRTLWGWRFCGRLCTRKRSGAQDVGSSMNKT